LRECYVSLKKTKQVLIIKNVNLSEFAILNNKTAFCVKNNRKRVWNVMIKYRSARFSFGSFRLKKNASA